MFDHPLVAFVKDAVLCRYRQWAKPFPPTNGYERHFPTTGGLTASLKSRQSNNGNEEHVQQMATDGMRFLRRVRIPHPKCAATQILYVLYAFNDSLSPTQKKLGKVTLGPHGDG